MSEAVEIEVPGPVVRAAVTVEQVESYLRKSWGMYPGRGLDVHCWHRKSSKVEILVPQSVKHRKFGFYMTQAILDLACVEGRAPHLVLADIAAEPVVA